MLKSKKQIKADVEKYALKFSGKKFDCCQLFEKGIYYLYDNSEIVYIGESNVNVMSRILTHFKDKDKVFNSYMIFLKPDYTEKQLKEYEKKCIQKHNPKYNVIHNINLNQTNSDYEYSKYQKENCYHDFFSAKEENIVICRKCGKRESLLPSKTYLQKKEKFKAKKKKT